MFQQETLKKALLASGQTVTPSQLDQIFEQASQEWEGYLDQFQQEMTRNYQARTGRKVVEAMDRMTLLNLTRQRADEQIYADYIQPLTDRISEMNLDSDEDEVTTSDVLASPSLWKTHWDLVQIDPEIEQIVFDLWPDKPTPWPTIAASYLTVRDHQGLDWPSQADSELVPIIEREVDAATAAR